MYETNNKNSFCHGYEPISKEKIVYNNNMISMNTNNRKKCNSCRYKSSKNCKIMLDNFCDDYVKLF